MINKCLMHARLSMVLLACAMMTAASLSLAPPAMANHSVLVEGESDFDGDGIIGQDEDNDGDQVFGTLNGGLAGVSNNGRVVVVTSGRFFEGVRITAMGAVVLEAAPGVDAIVEAFNAGGDPDANTRRQNAPGIVVDSDGSFPVEIRNIVSRNWTIGILVKQNSRVTIDGCRIDSNVNYGIRSVDNAKTAIINSVVTGTGFRRSGTEGVVDAMPGIGISYTDYTIGTITDTTVSHSFSGGLGMSTPDDIVLNNVTLFNNNPDIIDFN